MSQAGTQTVAEIIRDDLGLAVYYLDGTFRTAGHTLPAAVAQCFVDLDYFSDLFHGMLPWESGLMYGVDD
jgi:hypothetical protein